MASQILFEFGVGAVLSIVVGCWPRDVGVVDPNCVLLQELKVLQIRPEVELVVTVSYFVVVSHAV
jgi:hypothetical protein